MYRLLSFFVLLLCVMQVHAQCNFEWDGTVSARFKCLSQRTESSETVPLTCAFSFRKAFLDSIVKDFYTRPFSQYYGKSKIAVERYFRKYKYDTIEVVHRRSKRFLINGDTVIVSLLSSSLWDGYHGEWNEDGRYDFYYSPTFGILYRSWWDMGDPYPQENYLTRNSCHTESQQATIAQLMEILKTPFWQE